MVAVPTHFFKVVLAESGAAGNGGSAPDAVLGAFVIPNATVQADMPLTAFSVSLGSLEEAAGEVSSHMSHHKSGTLGHPCAPRLIISTAGAGNCPLSSVFLDRMQSCEPARMAFARLQLEAAEEYAHLQSVVLQVWSSSQAFSMLTGGRPLTGLLWSISSWAGILL